MTDKQEQTYFPAFPQDARDQNGEGFIYLGMTLRDYFAAKALSALIIANGPTPIGGWTTYAERTAYAIADAMMEARK